MTESSVRPTETVHLHFDLSHLTHLPEDQEFTLRGHGKGLKLQTHNDETRRAHAQQNMALAAMPDHHLARITHFCPDVEVPTDAVSLHWVGYESDDPEALTDDIGIVYQHVPSEHARRSVRAMQRDSGVEAPVMLADYGLEIAAVADIAHDEDLHVHSTQVKTPIQTALTIVMQHPEIGTFDPALHHRIAHLIGNLPSLTAVWSYISTHWPGADQTEAWYTQTIVEDAHGNVMSPAEGKDKNGEDIVWPTKQINGENVTVIPRHELAPGLDEVVTPIIKEANQQLKQQPWLKGHTWTTQHGVTVAERTGVNASQPPAMAASRNAPVAPMAMAMPVATAAVDESAPVGVEPKADWTIKNVTSQYGLDIHGKTLGETLKFDGKRLSFKVRNWPNRGLGVYQQSFNPNRESISGPDWIQLISAGNVFYGAPIWTDPVEISFDVLEEATSIDVLLGGLGNGNWDMDVDKEGLIYTCCVSYGIPGILSVLSVGVQGTKWYMEFFEDPENTTLLVKLALSAALMSNAAMGLKKTLIMMGKLALGILLGKLFFKLAAKIYGYTTMMELAENVPFAGWALRIASLASSLADMVATSVEVGLSPATYTFEIKRSMDLQVTVSPDPTHGTSTQAAIWPKVADHWMITVQYEGGTTLRKAGAMPGGDDTLIDVIFSKATNDELPSAPGQKFKIIAAVYSETNWLAGQWISGWIEAVPTEGDMRTESGSIIEQLVPLTAQTNYYQKEKLLYDGATKDYVWENIIFSLDGSLKQSMVPGTVSAAVSAAVIEAFLSNGVRLSDNTQVEAVEAGHWTVHDADTGVAYDVVKTDIEDTEGNVVSNELKVHNVTYPTPRGTKDDLTQQRVSKLVDITTNNLAYKLGYCYYADNQNLPLGYGDAPQSTGMYLFQSISTLGHPSAGMKAPTRGFSLQPYIAYDQFGPAGLFELKPASDIMPTLDAFTSAGPAPDNFIAIFAANHYPLPKGAQVSVVTASASWRISGPTDLPLYDLRRQVDVIKIFNAPAPEFSRNNFYLDTRTYESDGVRHLRRVDLHDDSGSTFDYETRKSWGAFTMPDLDAIVVHPNGFVVAISYQYDKMSILELPKVAVDEADAPRALPLSGKGLREGLMHGPVAMTITADGRILVLEQDNGRIQAFDTFGNPVQCFAAKLEFDLDAGFVADLNNGTASIALLQHLQQQIPVWNDSPDAYDQRYLQIPLFSLAAENFVDVLNGGSATPDLRTAFEKSALTLGDTVNIRTTAEGLWLISDESMGLIYDVRLNGELLGEVDVYRGMSPTISVKAPSAEWIVREKTNTLSFDLKLADNDAAVHAQRLTSLMRLKDGSSTSIIYLDIAAETKGFIYVLSYEKRDADKLAPEDYRLDIYNPNGSPLAADTATHNGHVNGARMTVDQWRTLFTLNYEQMEGPQGRPEPTISQWIPTTPDES